MDEISSESRAQTTSTSAENRTATDGEKQDIDDEYECDGWYYSENVQQETPRGLLILNTNVNRSQVVI
jgi:hypothetical protein